MYFRISSTEIRNNILDSFNGKLTNVDDKYGVINCNVLKTIEQYTTTQNSSIRSYEDLLISIVKNNNIDPDEYNLLKEVKLKCLTRYLNMTPDNRFLTINIFSSIGQISIDHIPEVILCHGDMFKYKKYITSDVAFMVFANKRIGGLILTSGCAQEEIKFMQNPELIFLKLKQITLNDDDAVIVHGAQKVNSTNGYGFDVEYSCDNDEGYVETLVFVDAEDYSVDWRKQYSKKSKDREIHKCLVAWSNLQETNIITGDWGCGAFKGNHILKFLIQVYASKVCGKTLFYFSSRITQCMIIKYSKMNDKQLLDEIYAFNT